MVGSSIESPNSPRSGGGRNATSASSPNGYFLNFLFRTDGSTTDTASSSIRTEADTVFAHSLVQGSLNAADRTYLSQLVVANTGLSPTDADKRVAQVFTNAQMAAEKARKSVAHSLLWIFLALLIGAFSASFAATVGGRQRDNVVMI